MEMKSTTNSALRLERGWLSKISQEAESHNQVPALAFSFVDESGKAVAKKNSEWVAIPMHVFKELVGG
jgi:hypothetical protein